MLKVALRSNRGLMKHHEILLECKDGMRRASGETVLIIFKVTMLFKVHNCLTQHLLKPSDVCPLPSSLGSMIVRDKQQLSQSF